MCQGKAGTAGKVRYLFRISAEIGRVSQSYFRQKIVASMERSMGGIITETLLVLLFNGSGVSKATKSMTHL